MQDKLRKPTMGEKGKPPLLPIHNPTYIFTMEILSLSLSLLFGGENQVFQIFNNLIIWERFNLGDAMLHTHFNLAEANHITPC